MSGFILKGDIVYSLSKTELRTVEAGYLVCIDGKSAGVYEVLPEAYKNFPIKDYTGKLIFPGMVDLHIHAPQFPYRGTAMDLELLDWLDQYAFKEEAKYADLDYAKKAYGIFADALKNSVTTRACIFASRHRKATEVLMSAMEAAGLVSYVGKVNMDREAPDNLREKDAEESARQTIQWIEETKDQYERTWPILTPRFIPSCTDELMEKLGEIQRTYHLPVQSHLSENKGEIEWVRQLRPDARFYGDAYQIHGLFGGDVPTVMAHCVYSSEEEMTLMKENGVFIAHCPASNTNISSGIAPVRNYMEADMKVGLGTDVAGGHTESMFWALTDAIQVSKLYWRLIDTETAPLNFEEAFYLATMGGGEFFGKVGSFESGYELDAIVLDDSVLPYVEKPSLRLRMERAAYLSLDRMGICGKYVRGKEI